MSSITDFTLDDVSKLAPASASGGEGSGYASADQFVNVVGSALEKQESGGKQLKPDGTPVTSKAGAIGIWQVMPKTAPEAAKLAGVEFDDVKYRNDANYNRKIGQAYLAKQFDDFQDPAKALAAYNAGPDALKNALRTAEKQGNPNAWMQYLPRETQNYVPAILARVNGAVGGSESKAGTYYTPNQTNYAAYKEPGPGATFGDYIKEVGAAAVDSLGSMGQAVGEVGAAAMNKATGTEQYEGKNLLKPASDAIRNTMTEGGKQARQETNIEGSVLDLLSGDAQLPSTGQGWAMIAANGFGSLVTSFLPVIGQAGKVATLTKELKAAEAAGDAIKAAQLAKEVSAATTGARVAGATLGGTMTGGAAAEEVRQTAGRQVDSMSHAELMANVPVYAEAFNRTGNEQQSRDAVVNSAAQWAGGLSAIAGAAGGAFNAKVVEDFLVGKGVANIAGNSFKSKAARAAGTGAVTSAGEGFQETSEKVGQNVGENIGLGRNATDNAMRNTAGDFVGGAVVGAPLGVGGGYVAKPGQPAPVVHPTLAPVAEKAAQGGILSKAAMAGNAGNLATGVMPVGATNVAPGAAPSDTPDQTQNGTDQTQSSLPPTDDMGQRVREIEAEFRTGGLLDALRLDGVNVPQIFDDLTQARNTKAPLEVRQEALSAVEELLQWAKANKQSNGQMDNVATPQAPGVAPIREEQQVPSVDAAVAALRDEQFSRLLSDNDRQNLVHAIQVSQTPNLPAQTRANAANAANEIVGRYQAPQGQATGHTTPGLETPAATVTSKTSPAEQQFVNPATGAIQESDYLADVDAPKVAIPAGKDPAFIRRRAAEIKQLVAMGFESVERNGSEFYLINSKTGQRFKLSGMADSQLARKAIADRVNELAHTAASSPKNALPEPTKAQIEAGNYKKSDVIELNGMQIKIENPKDSMRRGTSPDGEVWETKMAHHYGEFQGTLGADGDKLDVFVGPRPDSQKIYVIDQKNADGSFDEHKVMMGFTSEEAAREGYLANYEKGWTGLGAITEMGVDEFKSWAKSRAAKKPAAAVAEKPVEKVAEKASEPVEKTVEAEKKPEAAKEAEPAKFTTLGEAKAYISAQRRGGTSISALPYPNEDGTFGIAVKGSPGYAKAEKFAADQNKKTKKAKKPSAKQGDMFTVKDNGKDVELQKVSKEELPTDSSSVAREGERRQLTQNDVSLLQRLASALGKEIQIFSGPVGDGFVRPEEPNTIYINEVTSINPVAVFGHELFHKIKDENPKAWEAIAKVVEANIGKDAFDKMMGYGYTEGEVLEEIVSDLGGDFLSDGAFWRDVFGQIEADNGKEAKGIIAKLVAYLNNLVEQLINDIKQPGFNASSLVKDIRAVRAAYKEGITQYLKDTAITRPALQAQILREESAIKKSEARGQPKVGIHFSKEPRTNLIGSLFGTGLKGAERERLSEADDMRIKRRISFYVDEGNGITPESGVGGVAHEIKLPKLYDAAKNAERLFKDNDLNGSESRVLDAGYDGYWVAGHSNKQGVGVILGDAARSIPAKVAKAPKAIKTEAVESTVKKGLVSKEIEALDMANIPGATMRAGILSVPVGSREQANAELARIGSVLRFSKDRIETAEEKAKREYAEVEAQYKGTDGWLKAPNGQATELDERQWVQVRTPSFKAWFGDWEKAANGNGVFGDMQGEVSVAVDDNGEPLVVYHGTNKGGFSEFKKPGGEKRGDLGIFTTPNLAMAQTYYSRRGGEIELPGNRDVQDLLDEGYDIYETDDGKFEVYNKDGYLDNTYDTRAEAEEHLLNHYDTESLPATDESGYYAMFINIRNPEESDFEGAHWNGERPGRYQVMNQDGELQYDTSGKAYFDMFDDANEFAKTVEGGEVQPADDHYETTDSVVRGAKFSGSDGAYIHNVVDSGPGYSAYIDEPSDVFVALDPNQLKSANFNNGSYSTTNDDIRKSVDRSAEEARQYKLDIEREQRAVGKAARLSADEVAAIATDAAKLGLTKAQVKALADDARRIKKQFPESEDWAQISVAGIQVKLDDDKKPVPGSEKPKFQVIPYGFNVPPGKDRAPAKTDEAWMAKVATKFEALVLDIYDRAEKGDKNAQIIIGHQTWYRNVAEVLRREYGGAGDLLADLLGATSPNTPVDTNWKFSLDVMRQFMAGKFNDQLAKFSQFLEEGGDASKYPAADKIRQVSGKLYGMNSVNAMKALVDMWRAIEPGQAPKARNFALNLIGQSNMATIDVWAARMLRRAADLVRGANLPRIPPPAEAGVSGVWNADATKVTGAFGFGAEVMDQVAAALEKRGIKVTPPDLQAIAWFAEKELWGQKGWTTKTGEGGSFEENIEATPVERYVAGWSIQQGEKVPATEESSVAQTRVMSMLVGDDSVIAARVLPTSGLYGGTVEASFDTEWTAMKGRHDPSMVMAEIAKIAQENKQLDIFVSKVVGPKEDNANARPGVEIYFRTARDLESAKPVLEKFTAKGQDGFTMVVDPRVSPKGVAGESFIGVRLQYVPEIAMRFDPALRSSLLKDGAIERLLAEKEDLLSDIAVEVRDMGGVAFAALQKYDTVVVGKENYSDYIDRIAEGADNQAGSQAWFGQPIRQGLEGAAARLSGDVGQDGSRGVSDAGRAVRASRGRDVGDRAGRDQGRSLAPLAGAPTVAGATGPDPRLVQVADEYARANGIDLRRQDAYVKVDAERATRIAAAYDAMEHAPQDPKVKEAFENLIKQTTEQYKALEKAGYKFYLYDETNDPYAGNPWNAMRDLRANKVMGVFATEAGFGSGATELNVDDNPLLADTGIKWPWGSADGKPKRVLANDLFRAVHDAFGHGLEGAGFRAEGEENAWQAHARMFKGSALGALTSETRGQNSWLNYGPYGERNRNAKVEDTVFADQKTGLMPSWTWEDGGPGDGPNGGKKSYIKKSVDRFPDTPEFKRWFGDSKAVNAKGEPLVVYHGTSSDFAEFSKKGVKPNFTSPQKHLGFFFSDSAGYASAYAGKGFDKEDASLMPVYLSLQNPKMESIDKINEIEDSWKQGEAKAYVNDLKEQGHDGIIFEGDTRKFGFVREFVAFEPNQIKSATGNNGEYSDSPNITKSLVRTPEFGRWFKNSEVVDAEGSPQVMYHGTTADFSTFTSNRGGLIYFTKSADVAQDFADGTASDNDTDGGENIMPVYLSAQNIFDPDNADDVAKISRPIARKELADGGMWDAVERYQRMIKSAGFDGVYVRETPATDSADRDIAVFSSEQVKSATGNSGDFDSTNPDITKSRSRAPWLEDVEKLKLMNGYQVGDLFNSSKKLSWWDKSIGTMYNVAEKHPQFKRVFDAVQTFIDDVSVYANRAADKAPTILPKLENWKDIWKSPLSGEDVKALAAPIFQGTLSFSRDANGDLQPEGDVSQAGVVFSDQELRDYFQLNDEQIGLYREFRNAVDQSVTDLALSDMLRYLGEDGDGVRQRVMGSKSVEQAEREIRAHLDMLIEQNPNRAESLTNDKEVIQTKADQAVRLMERGYAPLSRYGQYTVYVVGKGGEQEYFGMFETQREANKMAREMREQYPDSDVQTGTMSQESYKLFSGVTPETLALFGESMGLEESGVDEKSQAYQQYLKLAKSNRSAMKRLIQRKGIDGFSEDAGRVLAGFVYSNARQVSTNLHAGEISKSVMDVKDGDVKDAAIKLMQYIQNPQEEAQAIRGLMFAQFIGGSVASALVNMTQPFTMTMPYLSQFAGVTGAAKRMGDAVKLVSKGITGDEDLAKALKRAEDDGVVSPQEVHQLMAQSQGKGALQSGDGTKTGDALAKANNTLAKISLGWGKLFSSAEQFNRRVTFIAAYKMARDQKMADPFAFAENAIRETQGVYNKGNKPQWARGAVGATLFTFKQYSIAYVEFLQRMWGNGAEGKKAVGLALAVLFLMSGLGGMPGADDLDDVIDGIAQRVFNKSFDSKQAKKEFFANLLGNDAAEFVMGGITSIPGSPIDLSGRMGLGNLIPGTGVLTKKTSYTRDVMEIAGPAGSMVSNWLTAAGQLAQGEVGKAAKTIAPVAAQNWVKAADMYSMGQYRDEKGRKVVDVDAWEAIAKGIGFQPSSVKQVQEATSTQQNLIGQNKIRETEIADLWTAGRVERDQSKIDRAKAELAQWNKDNPASPIKIDPNQINKRVQQANMNKAQRIAATAPKEIRGSVKKELESLNQ